MHRTRFIVATAGAAVAALALAPMSHAASPRDTLDISGTWKSASVVIDSGAPYYTLTLTSQCKPASCYSGVLQFPYTDGKVGKPIKVGVAQDANPTTFSMVFPGGALIDNKKVIRGHVGNDGSLSLSRCWTYMKQATKATADTLCDFPAIAN